VYLLALECQAFTVTGGSVTFFGLDPGSTAVVTCDPELYADNGDQQMTVTCRSTGQWTFPNPGCSSKNYVLYHVLWSSLVFFKVARARTRRKNTFPIHTFKTLIYRSNWQDVSTILFLFHQNLLNNTKYQKIRGILHFVSMDTKWDSPW